MCWRVINCGNGKKLRVIPEGTICQNCASKNMEEIINGTQQLKAEIASRLRDYDEYTANGQHVLARQSLQAIRQLSAV